MYSHTQPFWNNYPALTASLCGVLGVHGNDSATSFFRFVVEHLPKHPKSRISSREGEAFVLQHKIECQIFNCDKAIRFCEYARSFVPKVKALVLNVLVDLCNLKGRFSSAVTALFPSGQPTLSNPKVLKCRPQPARVINGCAIRQSQERFQSNVNTNGRVEIQLSFWFRYFALKAHVPFAHRLFKNDVFNLCTFGQRTVILHFHFTDVLYVENRAVIDSELAPITVPVFKRVKAVLALEVRKARCQYNTTATTEL